MKYLIFFGKLNQLKTQNQYRSKGAYARIRLQHDQIVMTGVTRTKVIRTWSLGCIQDYYLKKQLRGVRQSMQPNIFIFSTVFCTCLSELRAALMSSVVDFPVSSPKLDAWRFGCFFPSNWVYSCSRRQLMNCVTQVLTTLILSILLLFQATRLSGRIIFPQKAQIEEKWKVQTKWWIDSLCRLQRTQPSKTSIHTITSRLGT